MSDPAPVPVVPCEGLPATFAAFAADVERTAEMLAVIGSADAIATGHILHAALRALGTALDLAAAAIRAAAPTSH